MIRFFSIVIFCLFAQAISAQSIIAKTARNSIALGQIFEVSFELNGLSTKAFIPPNFKGVQIVGTSERYASSISNGKVHTKNVLLYSLKALNEGVLTIPPATAIINGKRIVSQSLSVKVGPPLKEKKLASNSDLFLEVAVSEEKVYPGSQVVVKYILHSRLEVTEMRLIKEDDYKTFIFHNLNERIPSYESTINGQEYESRVIRSVALYPTQAGLVKIEPLVIEVTYRPSTGGVWGQVFAALVGKSKIVKSKGIDIRTNPFPKPIPNDFSGASGVIEMSAYISDVAITTDDAVSLKIEVSGSSNPTEIKAPTLELPDDLIAYPATVIEDTIIEENERFTFKKTFEYLLQPQAVKQFSFLAKSSYFDVASNTYKEIKTDRMNLEVGQGKAGLNEEEDSITHNKGTQFLWWGLGLLGAILIGLFGWTLRKKGATKAKATTNRKQPKKAIKPMPKQKDRLKEIDVVENTITNKSDFNIKTSDTGKPYLKEVLRETTQYFEAQLDIPQAKFTKELVFKLLEAKGGNSNDIQALRTWWTQMESAIYANMPLPYEEIDALKEIKDIVARLEDR